MTATTGEIPLVNRKAAVYPGLLLSRNVVIDGARPGAETIIDSGQHLVEVTPDKLACELVAVNRVRSHLPSTP
jgi:hypothetical protein